MVNESFTLEQPDFALFLSRLTKELKDREFNYVLVGGIAVQSHIAHALTTQHDTNLLDLEKRVGNFKLSYHLRPTDDVNLCLPEISIERSNDEIKRIYDLLGSITGNDDGLFYSLDEKPIIKIRLQRKGHVNPAFEISVDGERERRLTLTINRNERKAKQGLLTELPKERYIELFDRATTLSIPYCTNKREDQVSLDLRVISPEDLIIIKLAQGRAPDFDDIIKLLAQFKRSGREVNQDRIRSVLSEPHPIYKVQNQDLLNAYEHFQGIMEALRQ